MYCSRCRKINDNISNNKKTCSNCKIRKYSYFRNLRRQVIGDKEQDFD